MLASEELAVRPLDTHDDLDESRLAAVGYIFHGIEPVAGSKRPPKAGTNLLHFARCSKLDKAGAAESKTWFRSIPVAVQHLDATFGAGKWGWCKVCEREITQKILNER